ncbi:MAG: hypothetical protein L0229_10855 [Blastocatellia bacterium]|nr:hypothetical protein [Blastocatellia bacterium]
MKILKVITLMCFAAALVFPAVFTNSVEGNHLSEAPTGFDNLTNGFLNQTEFEEAMEIFAEVETVEDGVGPVFNEASCAACHIHPVVGAGSHITELRAGHFNGSSFEDHPGDSLIHSRAIDPDIQEHIFSGNEVRTFRTSLSLLGDGFVEAIANSTLVAIAAAQPFQSGGRITGRVINVPVLEAGGNLRVGRFGWKAQHASLESFAADAYLNEMGITSPLQPTENTSNGTFVGFGSGFDQVPDPEDDGEDVEGFAAFMRATKAPPRNTALAATANAQIGEALFNAIGCAICHTPAIATAPPGTTINGGALTVHPALGNKIIRPYGDFLLHNVGTGDGIVQNGGQVTRNEMRTDPLWGIRTRNRFMHDGESLTFTDAILRHAGEATGVINNFRALSDTNKGRIITFLLTL